MRLANNYDFVESGKNFGSYIIKPIELSGLPDKIDLGETKLFRKSEFHITLLSVSRVAMRINPDNPEQIEPEIVEYFKHFVSKKPIEKFELKDKLRQVKRDERETVIVMVSIDNLENFFESLSAKYGVNIPLQPAHITLYSLDPDAGISLSSREDLDRDTKVIEVPTLDIISTALLK